MSPQFNEAEEGGGGGRFGGGGRYSLPTHAILLLYSHSPLTSRPLRYTVATHQYLSTNHRRPGGGGRGVHDCDDTSSCYSRVRQAPHFSGRCNNVRQTELSWVELGHPSSGIHLRICHVYIRVWSYYSNTHLKIRFDHSESES